MVLWNFEFFLDFRLRRNCRGPVKCEPAKDLDKVSFICKELSLLKEVAFFSVTIFIIRCQWFYEMFFFVLFIFQFFKTFSLT